MTAPVDVSRLALSQKPRVTAPPARPPLEVPADEVRDCLARVLASPPFAASERLKRFLSFAVEQALDSADGPKEYEIGVRVYDRGEDFDPAHDSIVRTEAARLRKRLDEYYENGGREDPIKISIPRGSYRAAFVVTAETSAGQPSGPAQGSSPPRARGPVWWIAAATLTLLALAAIWSSGLATVGRDDAIEPTGYVLIAEFINRTGKADLNGAIEDAVAFHLSSRAGVQPLPQIRVSDALRLMARPADSPVTAKIAREVALRDGAVRAVLDGALRGRGTRYEITARLRDPVSDRQIATYAAQATDDELLAATRGVATWVQAQTGGNVQPAHSLEAVTTGSLRAVQLYSEAYRFGLRGRWAHAETLLEQALVEDPEFASAYLLLAWARRNQVKPPETWKTPLARALALSARSTDVERLFIAGSRYSLEGRDAEAKTAYEALLRLSPGHFWANNNLASTLASLDPVNASVHRRRVADLRPNDARVQAGLAWGFLIGSDAIDEASALIARARTLRAPEDGFLLPAAEAFEAWARGDIDGAVRRMRAIPERDADDDSNAYALYVGMPLAGLGMHERARAAMPGFTLGQSARWQGWMALATGDLARARAAAARLEYPNALNAALLARVGRPDAAEALIRRHRETFAIGYNPAFHDAVWNVARAEVLVSRRRLAEAEPIFAAAMTELDPVHGTHLEYFLAAEQLGAMFEAAAKRPEATSVLERAVARRRRTFAMALTFWTMCARRLERLYREDGKAREAQVLRHDLERILAAADPAVKAAMLPQNVN